MKFLIILFLVAGLGHCSQVKSADNSISIEQVGSNNQYTISQEYSNKYVNISLGGVASSDNNNITINQQDTGSHSSKVELPNGINNGVNINQSGGGNQTTAIQNLIGSSNNVSVTQSGASNNTFNLIGTGTNNANTISATQTGTTGADKSFTLNMNGTNGTSVTIQQTNPTQSNSGSMSIQCYTGCGNYSYIRN
jgi:hypothetical protein